MKINWIGNLFLYYFPAKCCDGLIGKDLYSGVGSRVGKIVGKSVGNNVGDSTSLSFGAHVGYAVFGAHVGYDVSTAGALVGLGTMTRLSQSNSAGALALLVHTSS